MFLGLYRPRAFITKIIINTKSDKQESCDLEPPIVFTFFYAPEYQVAS